MASQGSSHSAAATLTVPTPGTTGAGPISVEPNSNSLIDFGPTEVGPTFDERAVATVSFVEGGMTCSWDDRASHGSHRSEDLSDNRPGSF